MQSTRLIVQNRQIVRNFCLSCTQHGKYVAREGKFLSKIMHGRSKRKWYNVHETAASPALFENSERTPSIHVQRRMTVLNKIFMGHITDFMSTGDAGHELLDRNIEISHVELSPDFKLVNVFWIDNSPDPGSYETSTEELLRSSAKCLRHELTQLRVIGSVPPIHFVKCKHYHRVKEVERRLQIADYGEDFEPSVYPYSPTAVVRYKNDSSQSKKGDTSETESTEGEKLQAEGEEEAFCVTLPVMRHDIFGLDRHKIMSKINVALERSRAMAKKKAHRTKMNDLIPDMSHAQNFLTEEQEKKEFSEFLIRREKEERRKQKSRYKLQERNILNVGAEDAEDDNDTDYEIDDDITDEEYSDFEDEP